MRGDGHGGLGAPWVSRLEVRFGSSELVRRWRVEIGGCGFGRVGFELGEICLLLSYWCLRDRDPSVRAAVFAVSYCKAIELFLLWVRVGLWFGTCRCVGFRWFASRIGNRSWVESTGLVHRILKSSLVHRRKGFPVDCNWFQVSVSELQLGVGVEFCRELFFEFLHMLGIKVTEGSAPAALTDISKLPSNMS
ncbi:hypothetical protein FNV43_RR19260 [Rhamnella rubrinervis]|uniref:Uncharacterized protein n=1 Tax=Rhamnella rubrinervis TaxID=2594499 RepID=A0A8K0E7U1_9ROSA|nr:hypothetical protein FNV43_RR19260 [Rhamnella rubrinervis]